MQEKHGFDNYATIKKLSTRILFTKIMSITEISIQIFNSIATEIFNSVVTEIIFNSVVTLYVENLLYRRIHTNRNSEYLAIPPKTLQTKCLLLQWDDDVMLMSSIYIIN